MAGKDRLARVLRVPPEELTVLDGCDDADVTRLTDAVAAAITDDRVSMNASIERALKAIPWPVRGQARRILTGSSRG